MREADKAETLVPEISHNNCTGGWEDGQRTWLVKACSNSNAIRNGSTATARERCHVPKGSDEPDAVIARIGHGNDAG